MSLCFSGAKIDCRDKDNETPLMMAVRKNNTDVVKLLAALGADVSLKDADDRTCLFIAAEEDCVETCKVRVNMFRFYGNGLLSNKQSLLN